jgi:hypothetical protein
MNRIRRKTLNEIYDKLAELRDLLEEVKGEEEDYRDNMPENLQNSERYEIAENACDNMDSAVCSIEEALDYIESAAE